MLTTATVNALTALAATQPSTVDTVMIMIGLAAFAIVVLLIIAFVVSLITGAGE